MNKKISKAYNGIAIRFQFYEYNAELLADINAEDTKVQELILVKFCFICLITTHVFLFENILSIAGKIRSSSDPNRAVFILEDKSINKCVIGKTRFSIKNKTAADSADEY